MPDPEGATAAPPGRPGIPLPAVSVVIPAYNYERFLPQTIDSILRQSHADFELIVVDDGSTDGTRAVVEGFTDPRVRYVWQKNAGLPAARNTGIREARHAFIGLVDADDLWWPDLLERCVSRLLTLPADYGLVACRHDLIDPEGNPVPKRQVPFCSREILPHEILLRSRFGSSSVVARREAFVNSGWFDESLTSSEDRDMWIRMGMRYRLWLLDEVHSSVRLHPVSMSRNAARMDANARRVFAKARAHRVVPAWKFWWWLRLYANHRHETAWMYFDQGKVGTAIRETLLSLLTWPWIWKAIDVYQPPFFRARSLARFLRAAVTGRS